MSCQVGAFLAAMSGPLFGMRPDEARRTMSDEYRMIGEYNSDPLDCHWPRSQNVGTSPFGDWGLAQPTYWRWPRFAGAARSVFVIEGQCLDQNGIPVGPCTVESHTTSDGEPRGSTTSDSSGNYRCPTDIPDVAHYVRAYKTGSPDMAGISRQDLIPT